jgi:hypothetical protein
MDKKLEKVKAFVREHGVEIACAVGAVVCGVVVFAVTKRKLSKGVVDYTTLLGDQKEVLKNIEVPEELVKYGVDAIDNYSGAVEFWTACADTGYKVAVADLGKFGEALCKIPDIKPENKACVLINIAKEIDNN